MFEMEEWQSIFVRNEARERGIALPRAIIAILTRVKFTFSDITSSRKRLNNPFQSFGYFSVLDRSPSFTPDNQITKADETRQVKIDYSGRSKTNKCLICCGGEVYL